MCSCFWPLKSRGGKKGGGCARVRLRASVCCSRPSVHHILARFSLIAESRRHCRRRDSTFQPETNCKEIEAPLP